MTPQTLTQQLLQLIEYINGEGGVNFVRIRAALESVERLAETGDPLAARFTEDFGRVCKFVRNVVTHE